MVLTIWKQCHGLAATVTKKWQNSGDDWAKDGDGPSFTQPEDTPMFMQDLTAFDPAKSFELPTPGSLRRPALSGLLAGTLVETQSGWQDVEALRPGVLVQTLDGGLARLMRLDRRQIAPGPETVMIHLPGGVLDACSDLTLLPGQHLLVDTLDDPAIGGAPFALVPALALLALKGPRRIQPAARFDVLTPLFAEEEGVYAQSGVLFHCPGLMDGAQKYPEDSFFPLLDLPTAREFLRRRQARLA